MSDPEAGTSKKQRSGSSGATPAEDDKTIVTTPPAAAKPKATDEDTGDLDAPKTEEEEAQEPAPAEQDRTIVTTPPSLPMPNPRGQASSDLPSSQVPTEPPADLVDLPEGTAPPAPDIGDPDVSVPLGTLINNNYRVQSLINAGGMGEVFRGENAFTGDLVAIKIILQALAQDEKVAALFKREARILCQLSHEAIVRYHNFVRDADLDRYCLIMEFIDGTPLSDHVKERGPISVEEAKRLILRLADGLEKAHKREVTHRDLSPDNVMLRSGDVDQPVLIDFGIAKSTEMTEGTLHGQFAGKFKYISPEQLGHFDGVIGPRTDVYGLALLIAAATRGTAIDMGSSVVEAVNARRQIPNLTGVPDELQPLLSHMLEPNPFDRPARMIDVARMVQDPSLIPAKYGTAAGHSGNRTVIATPPGRVQAPPHVSLSAPPATLAGTADTSGSPFGGGSADPFSMPLSQSSADEPKKGGARAGLWISIAVGMVITGAGFLAYDAGLLGTVANPEETPAVVEAGDPPSQDPPGASLPPPNTGTREGFLADFDAGECSFATRVTTGINSGKIEGFASQPDRFVGVPAAYGAAFGAQPAVIERIIDPAQCAALDLARALQGRVAQQPVLSLDTDVMTSGGSVVGRVRDVRGRSVWLFLVTTGGGVFDLSPRLQAQGDGSYTFSFGMAAGSGAVSTSQLLVAVASEEPLVSAAAATDSAAADELLPLVLAEIEGRGGTAAASVAYFQLEGS